MGGTSTHYPSIRPSPPTCNVSAPGLDLTTTLSMPETTHTTAQTAPLRPLRSESVFTLNMLSRLDKIVCVCFVFAFAIVSCCPSLASHFHFTLFLFAILSLLCFLPFSFFHTPPPPPPPTSSPPSLSPLTPPPTSSPSLPVSPLPSPSPSLSLSCEAGDLAGRFGPLPVNGQLEAMDTTGQIDLDGFYSIVGRSVVIHQVGTNANFECGTIISQEELDGQFYI